MAYTEYGFGPDAVVASGSIDTRINNGRDEVNSNNGNEGGIRFIEDGVEFWFSASDTAAINKGVSQLRTDSFNGIDGSLYAQTSNQTSENFPGGESDPALLVPPGDIYKLRPVDTGLSFVGTAAEPLTLVFGNGLGIWEVTFHRADGTTLVQQVGNDLREQDTLGDGVEPQDENDPFWNWLDTWGPDTISVEGVFTHITFESLTPQLVLDKSPTFQLDSLTAELGYGPTDLGLSNTTVDEADAGAVVGDLTVTDPDHTSGFSYSVSDDRFEVVNGQLKLKDGVALDYEQETQVSIDITVTDPDSFDYTENFTIDVTDINNEPSDLALSNTTVNEADAGAVIGDLTVTDPDHTSGFSYTVSDDRFEVVNGQLKLKDGVALDYEQETQVPIDITVTDPDGKAYTETFAIDVADVNDPTDLELSNATVNEADAGAVIGDLTVTDPDHTSGFSYTVSDDRFEVVNGQLKLKDGVALDYEQETQVSIDITVTDPDSFDYTENFTIDVTDINNEPSDLSLSNTAVNEAEAGAAIGDLTVTDPDHTSGFSYTVSDDRFEVVNGQLKLKDGVALDYEQETQVSIDITVTDPDSFDYTETFAIDVTDINDPTDLALDNVSVDENDVGAAIGNLTVTDPDHTTGFTYTVSDDRFEVVSGQLKLKDGVALDYEQETQVSVDITVTDPDGFSYSETFDIQVGNVDELVVTTLEDIIDASDGEISLREALMHANANVGTRDTITFADHLEGTIRLKADQDPSDDGSNGEDENNSDYGSLGFARNVIIDGDNRITISGDTAGNDVTTMHGDVEVTDLSQMDADSPLLDDNVGIFYSIGQGSSVGSINVFSGLTLTGGTRGTGGAIYGGSIDVLVHDSTLIGNQATTTTPDVGGGALWSDRGLLYVLDSTLSGNRSESAGGAIATKLYSDFAGLLIHNSTLTDNHAAGEGDNGKGGAVYISYGISEYTKPATNMRSLILNSTIVGNKADSDGGGIATDRVTYHIANSIVLGNGTENGENDIGAGTQPVYFGDNLIGGVNGLDSTDLADIFAAVQTYDLTGLSGGELADNGGNVWTMALKLAAANPALDGAQIIELVEADLGLEFTNNGNLNSVVNEALVRFDANGDGDTNDLLTGFDARGVARAIDVPSAPDDGAKTTDIGAFELEPSAPTDLDLINVNSVDENDDAGVDIGDVTVVDEDHDDNIANFTFSVSDGRFEVVGSKLRLKANETLDYEVDGANVSLTITVTDLDNQSYSETFNIVVNDVDEAPTDLALSM